MPRLVAPRPSMPTIGPALDAPAEQVGVEEYFERVAKYIPGEIVAAYITVRNVTPDALGAERWPSWMHYAVFATLIILNVFYLRAVGGKDAPRKARQIAIGCTAFLVWAYALGGPVIDQLQRDVGTRVVYPSLGAVILVFASLGFALYDPRE